MKTDLEIFTDWRESSIAKHIITENSQAGAMIEFAKYYHKEQLKQESQRNLPTHTLEEAIEKAKPNLDKIKDVDKFLDDIQ